VSPANSGQLAILRSGNSISAVQTSPGAHNWTLMLLEIQANANGAGDIVELGDGSSAQTSLGQVPHDLVIDRCYIHGDPSAGQKRGIALNSAATTITGSYISDIKVVGQDNQAIAGWNGPGPYTITNNDLEAAGENILFGGSDPAIPNLVPSDITIANNDISKPTAWRAQNWQVKNLVELKNAQRVQISGNIIEYNWAAAQSGYAVLFTVRNQSGGCPWCIVANVQFVGNVVRHSAMGISILGTDNDHPSQQTQGILIRNNVFYDIDKNNWGGNGYALLMTGGPRDVTVDHNTIIQPNASGIMQLDGAPILQFTFTNNLARQNTYGIIGTNHGLGNDSISAYLPASTITHNVIADGSPSKYPSGNFFPTSSQFSAEFVSYSGNDYRLVATSDWRGAGTDGGDLGANLGAVGGSSGGGASSDGATAPSAITITSGAPPSATAGSAYQFAFTAAHGAPPYAWQLVSSAPLGLTLDASGSLAGTPQQAGTFTFTVQVSDAASTTARQQVTLDIRLPPLTIVLAALPPAQPGSPYATRVAATGGQPPYRWSVASGSLPDGLTFDPATGEIAGTPQLTMAPTPRVSAQPMRPVARTISIRVADSAFPATTATATVTIVVESRAVIVP